MLPTQEILILRDPISKQNLFPPDIDLHRLKLYPEDRIDNCSMPITLETPPTRVSLDFEPRSRPCKNRRSWAPAVSKKGKTNRQLKARVTRPGAKAHNFCRPNRGAEALLFHLGRFWTCYDPYAISKASRSQFPVFAPASYVLCRKSSRMAPGDFAFLTSSYISRYSPKAES